MGDLALLYASGDGHVDDRRKRISPYVKLLVEHFSNHPALPAYLDKIEAALGTPLDIYYET